MPGPGDWTVDAQDDFATATAGVSLDSRVLPTGPSSRTWVGSAASDVLGAGTAGNVLRGSGGSMSYINLDAAPDDDHVGELDELAVIRSTGVLVRASSAGMYLLRINPFGSPANDWEICRIGASWPNGESITVISAEGAGAGGGVPAALEIIGSDLKAYRSGSQVIAATNTLYTTGTPGIVAYPIAGNLQVGTFTVYAIGAGDPPPVTGDLPAGGFWRREAGRGRR